MTATTEELAPIDLEEGGSSALRFLAAFLGGLLVALLFLVCLVRAYDIAYTGHILPGVHIGSVDVGGLTADEAQTRLEAAYADLAVGRLSYAVPTGTISVPYADLGRRVDSAPLIAAALAAGRGGSAVDQALAEWRLLLKGGVVAVGVAIDEDALAGRLSGVAAAMRIPALDASVSRSGMAFVTSPGHDGRELDSEAMVVAAREALTRADAPAEISLPVVTRPVVPSVSTAEADAAATGARRIAADLVLRIGAESWTVDATTVTSWVGFAAASDGSYGVAIDAPAVRSSLARLAKKIDRPAVDASFLTGKDGKVVGAKESRDGLRLDLTTSTAAVSAALVAGAAPGGTSAPVELTAVVTKPKITTEQATALAPQMVMISTWTTMYFLGETTGYGANIEIPTRRIDGTVIPAGGLFDFWKIVGVPTYADGYRQGGIILNGRAQPTGALAGGICACSSTIFNAALRAGMKMGARLNHYYYIERYPLGLDATVYIAGSSRQTMTWTNDTANPVFIRAYTRRTGGKGYVTFELWSVPTGRTVILTNPIVKNVRYATTSIVETTSLPPGTRKQTDHPADGKDVWVTRIVKDASGAIVHQETYYSHYSRVDGIIYVGVAAT